jgi:hypothetical protein
VTEMGSAKSPHAATRVVKLSIHFHPQDLRLYHLVPKAEGMSLGTYVGHVLALLPEGKLPFRGGQTRLRACKGNQAFGTPIPARTARFRLLTPQEAQERAKGGSEGSVGTLVASGPARGGHVGSVAGLGGLPGWEGWRHTRVEGEVPCMIGPRSPAVRHPSLLGGP